MEVLVGVGFRAEVRIRGPPKQKIAAPKNAAPPPHDTPHMKLKNFLQAPPPLA